MAMASQAFDPRMLIDRKSRLINRLLQQQQRPGVAARMGHSPSMGQPFKSSVFAPRAGGRAVGFGRDNVAARVLAALGVTAGGSPDFHPGGPAALPSFAPPFSLDPGAVVAPGPPQMSPYPGGGGGSAPQGTPAGAPGSSGGVVHGGGPAAPNAADLQGGTNVIDLGNGYVLNTSTGEIIAPDSYNPVMGAAVRGLGGRSNI